MTRLRLCKLTSQHTWSRNALRASLEVGATRHRTSRMLHHVIHFADIWIFDKINKLYSMLYWHVHINIIGLLFTKGLSTIILTILVGHPCIVYKECIVDIYIFNINIYIYNTKITHNSKHGMILLCITRYTLINIIKLSKETSAMPLCIFVQSKTSKYKKRVCVFFKQMAIRIPCHATLVAKGYEKY